MSILLHAPRGMPANWEAPVRAVFANEELLLAMPDDAAAAARVECVIVFGAGEGVLARLPNLKFISTMGMGVDHILKDPGLPPGVPIARVVDPAMIDQMAEYVTLAALRVERASDQYDALQRRGEWQRRFGVSARGAVGLLGMGQVGREAARRLHFLGFPVLGWSRTPFSQDGVTAFHGPEGLKALLPRARTLVCVLPLTAETRDLLDADLFARLPRGAHVVNIGRGEHLVEADLLAALESGHLGGATLDVFRTEPLPAGHPFWTHPQVRVTPHSAGMSFPESSARRVLENLNRVRGGQRPLDEVVRDRGY